MNESSCHDARVAKRFVHARPRAHNLALYLLGLAGVLAWVEAGGRERWVEFASAHGSFELIVYMGFALYLGWFWLLGAIYFALDDLRDRAAARAPEQRSRLGARLLRWEIQQPEPDTARTRDVPRRELVEVVLRNQFLGTFPALLLLELLLRARGVEAHAPIPGPGQVLLQLAGIILVLELAFYSVHRALHHKQLFRRIHRVHHEFRKPTGIATHYVHYLEHLFGNLLPVFLGPVLLGAHPFVIMLWVVIAVFNAIHTHGGYAIPGLVYAHDHDFHHYRLRGNYGSLGLLDALLRTNREFQAEIRASQRVGQNEF